MKKVIAAAGAALVLALALASSGVAAPSKATSATSPEILFDDFNYSGFNKSFELWHHGWKLRTAQGWPGIAGAGWSPAGISFVHDPANPANWLLRLTSSTDGRPAGTVQAQICQQRKFFEGTYATRVRFGDVPDVGPDGDQLVETFYAISPLQAPLDPNYSELDWEYLPNGGWGVSDPTLFVTSWETAQLEPYIADNTFTSATGSLAGWHTLVLQVANGTINYYLDGNLVVTHGGKYYPEVPMSINFNLWFIQDGQLPPGTVRRYHEDVDWVYHQVGVVLSPQQVGAQVASLRRTHVIFRDTVPKPTPPLDSACNF
jgi:hypothetical protein